MNKKFIQKDEEYVHLFEGDNYPKLSEMTSFISLCEVIREKCTFVHPLDSSDPNFKDKEKLCGDVLKEIKDRLES